MANELLTGNLLQDGITYHASDINAAINKAVALTAIIENQPVSGPNDSDKFIASNGTSLKSSTMLAVRAACNTNIATTGAADLRDGVSFSGTMFATVTGSLNDYNPSGFGASTTLLLSGTATITGMQNAPQQGTLKILYCATGTVTISRNDAGSNIVNRFLWGAETNNLTLLPGRAATFMYLAAKWVLICTNLTP